MFNETELAKISNGTFVLDFFEATLTQQKDENPNTYTGSASIVQDENKALNLKLIGTLQSVKSSSEQIMEALNRNLIPGKIVSSDNYYKFSGIDMSGKVWTAKDVSITSTETNFNHGGRLVHARHLQEIRSITEPGPFNMAEHYLLIPGKYKIPFVENQPDTSEIGRTKCTVSIENGRNVIIKSKGNNLIVIIKTDEPPTDDYKNRVLEAIGIAVGAHFSPQIEMIRSVNRYELVLRSVKPKHAAALRLEPPIPTFGSLGFPSFEQFIQCYLKTYSEKFHQVAGLWFRVLNASDSNMENQGLIISTACEGVVKAEFREEGKPSKDFLDQLEEAKLIVESLNIQSRAKKRLVSILSSGKNSTMANALYALEENEKIPETLRKTWQKLRHKMAHADELEWREEQAQNFFNELYACLELFYRLIMLRIQYKGAIRKFSKEGWPIESFFQSKEDNLH